MACSIPGTSGREGAPPGEIGGIAPPDLMRRLTRDTDYRAWMDEFLS